MQGDDYRRFIEMLIERRKQAKLSQQDVADALGVSQSFIAKIEKFERRVDVIELIQIASAIGFDPARFVLEIRATMIEHGTIED